MAQEVPSRITSGTAVGCGFSFPVSKGNDHDSLAITWFGGTCRFYACWNRQRTATFEAVFKSAESFVELLRAGTSSNAAIRIRLAIARMSDGRLPVDTYRADDSFLRAIGSPFRCGYGMCAAGIRGRVVGGGSR